MQPDNPNRFRPSWGIIWTAWMMANTIAAVLAVLLTWFLITNSGSSMTGINALLELMLIPVAGLLSGVAQYFVLAWIIPKPRGWMLVSVLGWCAGAPLAFVVTRLLPHPLNSSLLSILPVFGLALGTAQWLYLRRRLRYTDWWTPATLLGFVIVALMFQPTFDRLWEFVFILIIPGLFTGLLLGAIYTYQPQENRL